MIEEAIFHDLPSIAGEQPEPTVEQRMELCAKTIRTAFETNDIGLLKYALHKYQVHLHITPAEDSSAPETSTPPSHQSSAKDVLLADPEE